MSNEASIVASSINGDCSTNKLPLRSAVPEPDLSISPTKAPCSVICVASCNLADENSNAIFLFPESPVVRSKNVVSINPPSATTSSALSSSIVTISSSISYPGNLTFFKVALEIAKFGDISSTASA